MRKLPSALLALCLCAVASCDSIPEVPPEGAGPRPSEKKIADGPRERLADAPPALTERDVERCILDAPFIERPLLPAPGPQAAVKEIASQVERLRALRFRRSVPAAFVSSEALARGVRDNFAKSLSEDDLEVLQRVTETLGFIRPGTNLDRLIESTLMSQVAGYYEPDRHKLYVLKSGSSLGVAELTALAHELDHALTDQRIGIPDDTGPTGGREDDAAAHTAVVEGDASLLQFRFLVGHEPPAGRETLASMLGSGALFAQQTPSKIPYFLLQMLRFPYEWGLSFSCALYARGGWDAVNRTYERLPTTTAQIIFPSRYIRREQAKPVLDPPGLPAPWSLDEEMEMGAADLKLMFEAPGDDPERALDDPIGRAAAWAGGELHLWVAGPRTAVGIALREHRRRDDLCESMTRWYMNAFRGRKRIHAANDGIRVITGPRQSGAIACSAKKVRFGLAPSRLLARRLASTP